MENENVLSQESNQSLELTKAGQKSLLTMGNWMLFFGVLYSIGILFIVLAAVMMLLAGQIQSSSAQQIPGGMVEIMALLYFAVAVLLVFPTVYLFNTYNKLKTSIEAQSSGQLENALATMKNFWKAYGIITIVGIVLSIFFVVMTVVMTVSNPGMYTM